MHRKQKRITYIYTYVLIYILMQNSFFVFHYRVFTAGKNGQ